MAVADPNGRRCPTCTSPLHVTGRGFLFCSAPDCTWGLGRIPHIPADPANWVPPHA